MTSYYQQPVSTVGGWRRNYTPDKSASHRTANTQRFTFTPTDNLWPRNLMCTSLDSHCSSMVAMAMLTWKRKQLAGKTNSFNKLVSAASATTSLECLRRSFALKPGKWCSGRQPELPFYIGFSWWNIQQGLNVEHKGPLCKNFQSDSLAWKGIKMHMYASVRSFSSNEHVYLNQDQDQK